jgi:hypothetical protein
MQAMPRATVTRDATWSFRFNLGTPYDMEAYVTYVGSAGYWPSETRLSS